MFRCEHSLPGTPCRRPWRRCGATPSPVLAAALAFAVAAQASTAMAVAMVSTATLATMGLGWDSGSVMVWATASVMATAMDTVTAIRTVTLVPTVILFMLTSIPHRPPCAYPQGGIPPGQLPPPTQGGIPPGQIPPGAQGQPAGELVPAPRAAGNPAGTGPVRLTDSDVLLSIHVPPDAVVQINGKQTTQNGPRREFMSSGLAPGRSYTFVVGAHWTGPNGQAVEQERRLQV